MADTFRVIFLLKVIFCQKCYNHMHHPDTIRAATRFSLRWLVKSYAISDIRPDDLDVADKQLCAKS